MKIVTITGKHNKQKRREYQKDYYDGYHPLKNLISDILKKSRAKGIFYIVFDEQEEIILRQILLVHFNKDLDQYNVTHFLDHLLHDCKGVLKATYIPKKGINLIEFKEKYLLAIQCEKTNKPEI